jgi:arginine-tRNA-protein transferase
MVVWHIREAQRLELAHVYLGYWIAESPKMSYKTRFQPLEGLVLAIQGWRDLGEVAPKSVGPVQSALRPDGTI